MSNPEEAARRHTTKECHHERVHVCVCVRVCMFIALALAGKIYFMCNITVSKKTHTVKVSQDRANTLVMFIESGFTSNKYNELK